MKNFIQKLDHFFIHPQLQNNIEEYGRARILLYAMMMTTAFSTSYSLYYELTHDTIHIVKHIANIVGALTGFIGMLLLKFIGRFKTTFFAMLVLAIALVFTSAFFSGGIYSVDLLWMVVITMIGFLFVGNRGGLILMVIALIYFIVFFMMENMRIRDFAKDSNDLGVGYKLYNLFFLLGLASLITYFFVSGAAKIKIELDELKQKQVKTQLRKQIANDFHDEMGNKLAAITLNSNILSLKTKNNPEVKDILQKIENTSKSLYQHSRDFIWSIDAKSDELPEIFSYLRDFGEDFFHSLPIDFKVESKGFSEQENVILPMYHGRHIILIFKEILTNAARHAQCKNIILSLQTENENFLISVRDDGKGFAVGAKNGKGLDSIRERAKKMNYILHIDSSQKGTYIALQGELPKMGEVVK